MPRRSLRAAWPAHVLPGAIGALSIAAGLGFSAAHAQSFPCRSAHYPDEKAVCQDAGLAQLDQELAKVYRGVMLKLPRRDAEELDQNEDLFVRARRRCGDNRACIEQSYRNRIQELQSALPEEAPDSKSARQSPSKRSDRQKAGGEASDEPSVPSDVDQGTVQAVAPSSGQTADQNEAKAAPILPPPQPTVDTRSRHDEAASVVPSAPSRREAEAALASAPPPEKHARHKHRGESVAETPAEPEREKQPANTGTAVPERHAAPSAGTAVPERQTETSGGSTATTEPAHLRQKSRSRAKTVATGTPSPSPPPQEHAGAAAPNRGANWVNPAPSP